MAELTPDEHTPKLYRSRKRSWAVCRCTWQSEDKETLFLAQRAWAEHVAEQFKQAERLI